MIQSWSRSPPKISALEKFRLDIWVFFGYNDPAMTKKKRPIKHRLGRRIRLNPLFADHFMSKLANLVAVHYPTKPTVYCEIIKLKDLK